MGIGQNEAMKEEAILEKPMKGHEKYVMPIYEGAYYKITAALSGDEIMKVLRRIFAFRKLQYNTKWHEANHAHVSATRYICKISIMAITFYIPNKFKSRNREK